MDLPLVLSAESLTEGASAVVQSNVSIVSALTAELFTVEEVHPDALMGYYVDFYLAQVNNGGFEQFVHNTGWQDGVVNQVEAGLIAIGQAEHLALWRTARAQVDGLSAEDLATLLDQGLFDSPTALALDEALSDYEEKFYALAGTPADLTEANGAWLQSRPGVQIYPRAQLENVIADLVDRQPNRAERQAAAKEAREANMTAEERAGRRYCEDHDEEFEFVTAGSGLKFEGKTRFAVWFRTDRGLRIALATGSEWVILDSADKSVLSRWDLLTTA